MPGIGLGIGVGLNPKHNGPEFNPLDLNLIQFLESGLDNYTLDPTNISSWNASEGTDAIQLIPGKRPSPIDIEEDPFVQALRITEDHLDLGETYQSMLSGDFTFYFIIKPETLSFGDMFFGQNFINGTSKSFYIWIQSDGTLEAQFRITGTTRSARGTTVLNSAYLYIIEVNYNSITKQSEIWLNGVKENLNPAASLNGDISDIDFTTYNPNVNLFLNARNNSGNDDQHANSNYGDILLLNRKLITEERNSLGIYYVGE